MSTIFLAFGPGAAKIPETRRLVSVDPRQLIPSRSKQSMRIRLEADQGSH